MAEAVVLGSLLTTGAGATAGAATGAGLATAAATGTGLSAGAASLASAGALLPAASGFTLSFGTIMSGLGLAGQLFSFFGSRSASDSAYRASLEASKAELESAKARVAENDLQAQRERTQAALEEEQRQRRLRRTLAAQRAAFAGGSIDAFEGSPVAIQEATASEINRESRLAALAVSSSVSSLNIQKTGIQAAGAGRAASLINTGITNRQQSNSNSMQQLVGIAGGVSDLASTIKTGAK